MRDQAEEGEWGGRPRKEQEGWRRWRKSRSRNRKRDEGGGRDRRLRREVERGGRGRRMGGRPRKEDEGWRRRRMRDGERLQI